MALENLTNQISTTFDSIQKLDFEAALNTPGITQWNGLDQNDFRKSYEDFNQTMSSIIEQDALNEIPFNIINSLNKNLTNLFQHISAFVSKKDQNTFQTAVSQLESMRTNLQSWGIKSYLDYGQHLDEQIQAYSAQYQKVVEQSREIDQLKTTIQNLIEPAVAGSLSAAFSRRQGKLLINQRIWLVLTLLSAIAAIWGTVHVIDKLVELFSTSIPESITEEQLNTLLKKEIPNGMIILLRLGILIPLYTLFAYFFRHYNKERDLEEEYAHRAAVASSLPHYGNLAGAADVKDQIVSSASQVIFTSPINKKTTQKVDNKSVSEITALLEKVKDLVSIRS